jgi:5-methylthioadenosine/S-adenosylhomocysteine deaminase
MILLKNIQLDGAPVNIYIQGQRIHRILPSREMTDLVADETVDCTGKAVIPGFINMHTHAAMILLRGITEDVPLDRWLSKIWAMEAKMDEEFIYWGTKAACLEMIRSGTTNSTPKTNGTNCASASFTATWTATTTTSSSTNN